MTLFALLVLLGLLLKRTIFSASPLRKITGILKNRDAQDQDDMTGRLASSQAV